MDPFEGKRVEVYSTRGGRSYSSNEVGAYLREFTRYETLRFLGSVSADGFSMEGQGLGSIRGVPITDGCIAYLALRLIEASNDYRGRVMTRPDLATAADMYFGISDPHGQVFAREPYLIRIGASQFQHSRRLRNLLPRTIAIYDRLWKSVGNNVDVEPALEAIFGLRLREILAFGYAFAMRAKAQRGYIEPYGSAAWIGNTGRMHTIQQAQCQLLAHVSADFATFREAAKESLAGIPAPEYEKFRVNPLSRFPALRIDRSLSGCRKAVSVLPVPRLLMERVTNGLFFDLSEHFRRDAGDNKFRAKFGDVFEAYVGELLRDALAGWTVEPERPYGRNQIRGVDWVVRDGSRAILIEVKRSGIHQMAKSFGDLERARDDLSKTVVRGVQQLRRFESDIRSEKYSELTDLRDVTDIERVIVTHDRLYFANSVVRDIVTGLLNADGADTTESFHWHVISIDEFEDLLGLVGTELFEQLAAKRQSAEDDRQDFSDFCGKHFADRPAGNRYLDAIDDEFMGDLENWL